MSYAILKRMALLSVHKTYSVAVLTLTTPKDKAGFCFGYPLIDSPWLGCYPKVLN